MIHPSVGPGSLKAWAALSLSGLKHSGALCLLAKAGLRVRISVVHARPLCGPVSWMN